MMKHSRTCTVGLAVVAAMAVVLPAAAVGEPDTAAEPVQLDEPGLEVDWIRQYAL